MPTLMTCPTSSQKENGMRPSLPPPAITLAIQGVSFTLTPSNNDGVLSYRCDRQGKIRLDLSSFTGSLEVGATNPTGTLPSATNLQNDQPIDSDPATFQRMTTRVVEEPNSPDVPKDIPSDVSPGQQRLPFGPKSKAGMSTTPKSRNTSTVITKIATSKKRAKSSSASSQDDSQDQETSFPELSQTMDTSDRTSSIDSGKEESRNNVSHECKTASIAAVGKENKAPKSVQDILDRVNSCDESIATVGNDADDNFAVESVDSESTGGVNQGNRASKTEGDETKTALAKHIATSTTLNGFAPPCPRWGHTMTNVTENRILIYGGQDSNGDILSDVHIYDTAKKNWDKPINCKGEPRQWHSSTYLPDRKLLITFGGETLEATKKNKVVTTDLLRVLDTDIMLWYPPAVSGELPSGRSGHTATLLPNTNDLVLFGGVKGSKWLNSVSVLDTVRWVWSTPKILGSAPRPRSYHSATVVKAPRGADWYKVVVFGGNNKTSCFNSVHVLEAEGKEWRWSHPTVRGTAPFPRTGHSAVLLEDEKTICVYGGWDPNEEDDSSMDEGENIFKGSYLLNTETWEWRSGPKPTFAGSGCIDRVVDDCGDKRCGHTCVLEGSTVLAFGGRTPGERLAGDFQTLSASGKLVGLDG